MGNWMRIIILCISLLCWARNLSPIVTNPVFGEPGFCKQMFVACCSRLREVETPWQSMACNNHTVDRKFDIAVGETGSQPGFGIESGDHPFHAAFRPCFTEEKCERLKMSRYQPHNTGVPVSVFSQVARQLLQPVGQRWSGHPKKARGLRHILISAIHGAL